jgi:hypothetical protein
MRRPLSLAVQQRYRGGGRMEVSVRNSLVNFAGALHRRVRLRTQKSVTSSDSLTDSPALDRSRQFGMTVHSTSGLQF